MVVSAVCMSAPQSLDAQENTPMSRPDLQAGWHADFELAILQWYVTRDPGTLSQNDGAGGTYNKQPNGEYQAAPRVALSYLDSSGVGLNTNTCSYRACGRSCLHHRMGRLTPLHNHQQFRVLLFEEIEKAMTLWLTFNPPTHSSPLAVQRRYLISARFPFARRLGLWLEKRNEEATQISKLLHLRK